MQTQKQIHLSSTLVVSGRCINLPSLVVAPTNRCIFLKFQPLPTGTTGICHWFSVLDRLDSSDTIKSYESDRNGGSSEQMMKKAVLEQRCEAMRIRNLGVIPGSEQVSALKPLTSKPLSVRQASERSGMSEDWIRRRFSRVPGVLLIPSPTKRATRSYNRVVIPEEVFTREMGRYVVRVPKAS